MAALFVMYIPCDDTNDEPDNSGQSNGKDGGGRGVPEPPGSGGSGGPVPPPTFTIDAEDPAADKGTPEEEDGTSLRLSPLLRARLTARRGSEQLPLLAAKLDPAAAAVGKPLGPTASASLRSLSGGNKDDAPGGKFTVSKVSNSSDVLTLQRPKPNGSSAAEVKEPVHDISTEVITLTDALFDVLDALKIENDVWEKNFDDNCWQIKFVIDTKKCDQVLNRLTALGIGRIDGTSVSVFPASFHYSGNHEAEDSEEKSKDKEERRQKSEFIKSIKSRLTVAQVVGTVKSNATLTFDFLVLIVLASIIAGLGLAESSSVVLVASMLISPLMGPIIGFTFGIVVKNPELWKLGVTNELIGLSICLTFGFLFGLFTGIINNTGSFWGSSESWPTMEMQARGMLRSLWVGVMIALPSGAGVALSILGGNTGSLVGVAISASLLPPAVNAGMLWGLALVSAISHPPLDPLLVNSTYSGVPPDCHPLHNNEYEFKYSCDMPTEAAILASVSLLLTILNIICIFLMGIVVLKIKEIAPHRAMSPATAAFWKRDLLFARGAYQTVKGRQGLDMAKMARDVIAEFKASNPDKLVENVIEEIEHDPTLYEIPDSLSGKVVPQFLRQLSHEGHLFSRVREKNLVDTVRVGDRYYHTIANSTAARKYLEATPSLPSSILKNDENLKKMDRKGAVMWLHLNTSECPATPLSPETSPNLLVVDVRRPNEGRKMGRKERHSARMSTPTVGR